MKLSTDWRKEIQTIPNLLSIFRIFFAADLSLFCAETVILYSRSGHCCLRFV